jgi:hypothetical protein
MHIVGRKATVIGTFLTLPRKAEQEATPSSLNPARVS